MPGRLAFLRLIGLSVMVVTVSTQAVFLLGAGFFQIGSEFALGPVGLGALTAAFFLTASVSSVPLGRWVQRVGWPRAMRFNARATALILLGVAVGARDRWTMAGLLVAGAAVYGISNPAANLALSEHTDPNRRATIFGLKHAGIPASTLLAGFAVPAVIVSHGWRWAYVAAAAAAAALSFAVPVRAVGSPATRERVPPGGASRMSLRWLIGLATGSAFATWAAVALGTYLVSAAVDAGLSEGAAGWLQFAGAGISIGARIAAGVVTDRLGGRGFAGIASLAGLGSVVFGLLSFAGGAWFAVLVLAAFATGWAWPGLMTFTVVNANRDSAASSSAVMQAGVFIGAGAGPLVLGSVIERWSYPAGFAAVALALAISSVVVGTLGRRFRTAGPLTT